MAAYHHPSKASANLFQGGRAMSRSVWSAPYSGALTSGAPPGQWFRNSFAEAIPIPQRLNHV
jgi:hypothetical protein